MYRQTLQLQETVFGNDHPGTLAGINNLASSLCGQGMYVQAESMYRQTIYRQTVQLQETVLGKERPSTMKEPRSTAHRLWPLHHALLKTARLAVGINTRSGADF
jgi:hypothetical protein